MEANTSIDRLVVSCCGPLAVAVASLLALSVLAVAVEVAAVRLARATAWRWSPAPRAVRRLAFACCGLSLLALSAPGTASGSPPATAAHDSARDPGRGCPPVCTPSLDGLRLPDLPAGPHLLTSVRPPRSGASPVLVVAPGDCLWTLAAGSVRRAGEQPGRLPPRPRSVLPQPTANRPRPEPDLPRHPPARTGGLPMTPTSIRTRAYPAPAGRRWQRADETARRPYTQGALALTYPLPGGLETEPRPSGLTLVGGGAPATGPTTDAHAWAGRFLQAVVEVVSSDRPLTQLARWTDSEVYDDLGRRRDQVAQHRRPGHQRSGRQQVATIHVCQTQRRRGRGGRSGDDGRAVTGHRRASAVRARPVAVHRPGVRLT